MTARQHATRSDQQAAPAAPVRKRTASAHRQFGRSPLPVGIAVHECDLPMLAATVTKRIKEVRYSRGTGSYVFCSETGHVYVIQAGTTCAESMLNHNPAWFIGCYAADTSDGRRAVCPVMEEILGDLEDRFRTL